MTNFTARMWFLAMNKSRAFETLSVNISNTNWCLDGGDQKLDSKITLSICYPSREPSNNRDKSQQWLLNVNDNSLRIASNQSLCLTTTVLEDGSFDLRLDECIQYFLKLLCDSQTQSSHLTQIIFFFLLQWSRAELLLRRGA